MKALAVEICAKLLGPSLLRKNATSEAPQGPLLISACSACAGDYEDPDRGPWVTDYGEVEDVSEAPAEGEEFPAER